MKILSVEIEDFLSIGTARFELDTIGLTLIQGENRDNSSAKSNGSGKSALVDAIMWALYGETAREVGPSEIIRNGAKSARVRVVLSDEDGMTYGVERRRSKSKVELSLVQCKAALATTTVTDLTLGTVALTQDKVIQILGCSAEVFRSAVYLGQEAMPDLPRLTDKRLKELIEEAAGLSVIEACYERARTLAALAGEKLTRAQADVSATKGVITATEAHLSAAARDKEAWDHNRALRLSALESDLKGRTRDHVEAIAAHKPLEAAGVAAQSRLDEIAAELAGFESAQKALKKAQAAVIDSERSWVRAESQAKAAILVLKSAEEHLRHIEDGQPCESCGQDLPADDLAALRQQAMDAVAAARTSALEAARDVKAGRERAEQARAQSVEIERSVPDVTTLQALAETLRKTIDRALEAKRTMIDYRLREDAARTALDALRKETNPFEATIDRVGETLRTLQAQHTTQTLAVEELERASGHAKQVVAVFGPAGVRAEILDQVTPYLNARTAAYLDALSDGTLKALWSTIVRDAKGNPREKFSIAVTHPNGEGFAGLSGGEKRKVRLSTALALQDLVASRATKPIHLFIADEVDDALDEAGLERLMGVLSDKAREKGTVLVISHNSLTDWIPNTWTVTKERGVSTLNT